MGAGPRGFQRGPKRVAEKGAVDETPLDRGSAEEAGAHGTLRWARQAAYRLLGVQMKGALGAQSTNAERGKEVLACTGNPLTSAMTPRGKGPAQCTGAWTRQSPKKWAGAPWAPLGSTGQWLMVSACPHSLARKSSQWESEHPVCEYPPFTAETYPCCLKYGFQEAMMPTFGW